MSSRLPDNVQGEVPSPARMYDYFLGGYHNFEIDRTAARKVLEINPDTPLVMQANRAFLRRVVNFLLEQGIDQFLDIGSGIPTVGNVHEVARKVDPASRVVYVDVESVAVRHGEAILAGDPNVSIIEADLRRPAEILGHSEVARLLDLDRPLGVLLVSVLPFVPDREAYGPVQTLRDALAPGSYLAISHATYEGAPVELVKRLEKVYAGTANPVNLRSYQQTAEFFRGLDLVEPGLVYVPGWRPEDSDDIFLQAPEESANYGGVARKT